MKNDFEMPDLKENEENVNTEHNQNKIQEKIEIPQEYYDKIEKEKQEKIEKQKQLEIMQDSTKNSGATLFLIIINALLIFGMLYAMLNYTRYMIIVIPAYIFLGSIISSLNKGKETSFNVSILVGGMVSAIICFIVSMNMEKLQDTFVYYAIASFVVAFIGYVISSIITKIITDKENVKAMQKTFYFLVLLAIFLVPFYLYKTKKEKFEELVFGNETIMVVDTEEAFIEKTLKDRYGMEFKCDTRVTRHVDALTHVRINDRTCSTDDTEILVNSYEYNVKKLEFTVIDNYIDQLYLNKFKENITGKIKELSSADKVTISLYPTDKCYFVGECEANDNFAKEADIDNLYKYSKELKLKDYMNLDEVSFVNKYGFKYLIIIKGNYNAYSEEVYKEIIDKTLNVLKDSKLENKLGYEIILKDTMLIKDVYKVSGKNDFNNPKEESVK